MTTLPKAKVSFELKKCADRWNLCGTVRATKLGEFEITSFEGTKKITFDVARFIYLLPIPSNKTARKFTIDFKESDPEYKSVSFSVLHELELPILHAEMLRAFGAVFRPQLRKLSRALYGTNAGSHSGSLVRKVGESSSTNAPTTENRSQASLSSFPKCKVSFDLPNDRGLWTMSGTVHATKLGEFEIICPGGPKKTFDVSRFICFLPMPRNKTATRFVIDFKDNDPEFFSVTFKVSDNSELRPLHDELLRAFGSVHEIRNSSTSNRASRSSLKPAPSSSQFKSLTKESGQKSSMTSTTEKTEVNSGSKKDEQMDETAEEILQDEEDEVKEEDEENSSDHPELKVKSEGGEEAAEEICYDNHGGDPRLLELGKCLLVSKLPSAFLSDSFDIFSECVTNMLSEEFTVARDAIEKIVRVPKLQTDAESQDLALRAIVMFKSRVHKHRVFAQKKIAGDASMEISGIEELPREMLSAEDFEVADEVGEEEGETGDIAHVVGETDNSEQGNSADAHKESKDGEGKGEEEVEHKKKAYHDEDENAPFEISWDGAPEFQWKLCSAPGDSRRLTIENVFWSDLRNPFIYRVLIKAESVDISFPMRHNHEGSKQMYGKITVLFYVAAQLMVEAMNHLIYVRCTNGRRLKIYLPQIPHAMKLKEDFESRLGRVIKPTPRMHQVVVKILPKGSEFTIEDAKKWFPEQAEKITEFEVVQDEMGQPCGIVTFSSVYDAMDAHSSHSFITLKDSEEKEHKVHVFLKGVEAHFGSLLTRLDTRKRQMDMARSAKRPAPSTVKAPFAKKARGVAPSYRGAARGAIRGGMRGGSPFGGPTRGVAPRGGMVSSRGGRGMPFRGSPRGGRGHYVGAHETPGPRHSGGLGRGPMIDHSIEERVRQQRKEIELQEQMLRQQQIIDDMAAKLRDQDRYSSGYSNGPAAGGWSTANDSRHSSYGSSADAGYGAGGGSYHGHTGSSSSRPDSYARGLGKHPSSSSSNSYERRRSGY